ncbi:MAG TPA: hypothetical protein VFV99_12550 [Kofleriaceae bacterium]|nr:hypothetical protein [Kofleriaceae bacterium]
MSSADRVVRAGHGQLIATPTTIALIAGRDSGHLAVPLRRPFTLGTLRLELIPSGRTFGAAALHVDTGMRTVLYAGAIRTTGASEAADVRAADAIVVGAPIGESQHRVPKLDDVVDQLSTWVRKQLAAAKVPVLVVDTALDGVEVASKLVAGGIAVTATKSVRDAAGVISGAPALAAPGKPPSVIIRAETDRVRVAAATAANALVSVRAVEPEDGWHATFAWPFAASRDQLLGWIEQTRAKHVFVTGACAETIVAALGAKGHVLGPPQQMALFSS